MAKNLFSYVKKGRRSVVDHDYTSMRVTWKVRDLFAVASAAFGMSQQEWIDLHLEDLVKQAVTTQLARAHQVSLLSAFGMYDRAERQAEAEVVHTQAREKKLSAKKARKRAWGLHMDEVGKETVRDRMRRIAAEGRERAAKKKLTDR
jgi:hypothetical protein